MDFIEPLDLRTIFVNIFAGDSSYFSALAIFLILSISGTFKMRGVTLGFLVLVFFLMFSEVIPFSLTVLVAVIGGLLVGLIIPKIMER